MTVFQIVALALAGPIGLICFMRMFFTLIYRNVNSFELLHAFLLVICAIVIFISFYGVK